MTDNEPDEADLALIDYVKLTIATGLSAAEAVRLAAERIAEIYADPDFLAEPPTAHH